MKRSLLALTLLLTAPAFAIHLKDAQAKVNGAQVALDAEHQRREKLATEVTAAHSATQEGVGQKHESVMSQQQATFRGKTEALNHCVDRCKELQSRLHQVVAEVGTEHTVVSQGNKFSVQAAPKGNLEPIVRRQAESAPYSDGGNYRLAQ